MQHQEGVVQSKNPYLSTDIMWTVLKVYVSFIGYKAVLMTYGSVSLKEENSEVSPSKIKIQTPTNIAFILSYLWTQS